MLGTLAVAITCYLIGSVPFPVLVSRYVMGIDLRQHGSGNMGAMNAARVLGKRWFPVVFGLDFAKGALAVNLARALMPEFGGLNPGLAAALGGFLVVVGHCFPAFANFKGGVGLAASAGALGVISVWLLLAGSVAILLFWAATRNMYVGVGLTAALYPLLAWSVGLQSWPVIATMAAWGLVVFWLHLPDIRTWRAGKPSR